MYPSRNLSRLNNPFLTDYTQLPSCLNHNHIKNGHKIQENYPSSEINALNKEVAGIGQVDLLDDRIVIQPYSRRKKTPFGGKFPRQ